jgi:hypothetical protein
MRRKSFGVAGFLILVGALWCGPQLRADGTVVVAFPKGNTEIDTFQAGVPLIIGQNPKLATLPDEVNGLKFTPRSPRGCKRASIA